MSDATTGTDVAEREYTMQVLGKTIEHLGSQLYKQRDAAIAELVANAWDAGADEVRVMLDNPDDGYDRRQSKIIVVDAGSGMSPEDIDENYLVLGRNRRRDQPAPEGRKVMGRKGIGKLAGFGIAEHVTLLSWKDGRCARVDMPLDQLTKDPRDLSSVTLAGYEGENPPDFAIDAQHGSAVILAQLRHKTELDADDLSHGLARRFSRTARGEMRISVNGDEISEPEIDFELREPEDGLMEVEVDGHTVRYWYGFSRTVLTPAARRGFVVYVHNKTAQAPPYFFDVEATAHGQHGTKYLTGEIEADFLDDSPGADGPSEASEAVDGVADHEASTEDVISTDRQEIDWAADRARALFEWGQKLTRRALTERSEKRAERNQEVVREDEELSTRMAVLDKASQKRVERFVRQLGQDKDLDDDRVRTLASGVIAAFEYRHFHDFVEELDEVERDPAQLELVVEKMLEWRVLESRALLEVIEGRLTIVDRFHKMVVEDAPETAPRVGDDNLHDLLVSFPWLLNPEWQTFDHERQVQGLLDEWMAEDAHDADDADGDLTRVDFLSLEGPKQLVVVEIKRPSVATTWEEYQRLTDYVHKLSRAWQDADGREIRGFLVSSGLAFDAADLGGRISHARWSELHQRAKQTYDRYRALLTLDTGSGGEFSNRAAEVAAVRRVQDLDSSYLNKRDGKVGMAPADTTHDSGSPVAGSGTETSS